MLGATQPQAGDSISLQQQMIDILRRQAPRSGVYETAIEGLMLSRHDSPKACEPCTYTPALGFVVQGSKSVQVGDKELVYGPLTYVACSVHLPVRSRIVKASEDEPYLSFKISLDPQEITELILESGGQVQHQDDCPELTCGLSMAQMDEGMQVAISRLLALLESPTDIPVLSPLVRREIIYRALNSELGPRIRKFAATDSQAHRVSQVITTLHNSYTQPLRISELAEAANMSESSLFHTFKKVTRMSPLQFQKKLRLHEARHLMLAEGLDAASASYRVGYESPSQFSREYSRMFGAPPRTDVTKLRSEREPMRV